MTKLLVCPTSIENTYELLNKNVDGIILGIENYSVFFNFEVSIDEIKEILKSTNKEVFISINKILYNSDLENIRTLLRELSKLNIKGVMYESISILNINKTENLNLFLVWNQMHLPTNYMSCNFWYKQGVKYAYLSTEITLEDIIHIKKNSDIGVITYIYGYLPMFESSRELITNFFKYLKKDKEDDLYYLYEEKRDKYYPIYEKYGETFILEDILNGIRELKTLKENNIDYVVLNGLLHDEKAFNIVVDNYIEALNGGDIDFIHKKMNNNNTGFLYKETIYKVKP